ncbi:MAG: hypothetical protein GPJ54_11385 [Candidatus Heimdallarchaeota archaeon]|nr:hypothetical protein [Candidatus Heimdallarchaeota archaeon]
MEDPKRLRTKLRLDLNEVQKQIEEIEDQMRSDKSADTIERHKKLVEYEKKLKDQYEKIAGITIDQASSLDQKTVAALTSRDENKFSKLLGIVSGFLLFFGFYNLVIHSYVGFDPMDYFDYLGGTGTSVSSFDTFSSGILFESSTNLIVYPLIVGTALILIGLVFSTSGSKLYKFMQFLGVAIPILYLLSLIVIEDTTSEVTAAFEDNMINLGAIFIFGGMLYLFGLFDERGFLGKLSILIIGASIIDAGAQILVAALSNDELSELLWTWPWIMLPMMVASVVISFENLLKK